MNLHWAQDAICYHIYPLGLCGAPSQNNFHSSPEPRLIEIRNWINHIHSLGCNTLYLGPLFEASTHGYDTADYNKVDRRLGTNDDLKELIAQFHAKGIRVILDGVFNHVGRDFWAFKDLQQHGQQSAYRDWFSGVDFSRRSPNGDSFAYDGWNGHYSLVKLNLHNPDVREHIFAAVQQWMDNYNIDGLRLDAADVMDKGFLRDLAGFCRNLRPDFWLVGEVIHGDYRQWANPEMLHATTNYECYKGLYSSHNDANYFEIAHSLNRLFGDKGLYQHLSLYNFVDNHDVNRISSTLSNSAHLYPLHALLFSIPGIPSIYYGSEWGITGTKGHDTDAPLRPMLPSPSVGNQMPHPDLAQAIQKFAGIRHECAALRYGSYKQLHVNHEQLAFERRHENEQIIVAVNAADKAVNLPLSPGKPHARRLTDLLEPQNQFNVRNGKASIEIPASWARILLVE